MYLALIVTKERMNHDDIYSMQPEEEDAESQLLSRLARCINSGGIHGQSRAKTNR